MGFGVGWVVFRVPTLALTPALFPPRGCVRAGNRAQVRRIRSLALALQLYTANVEAPGRDLPEDLRPLATLLVDAISTAAKGGAAFDAQRADNWLAIAAAEVAPRGLGRPADFLLLVLVLVLLLLLLLLLLLRRCCWRWR